MAIVNNVGNASIGITDRLQIELCEIKEAHYCNRCDKKQNKGSFVVGRHERKFCLRCFDDVYKNIKRALGVYVEGLEHTYKQIHERKDYLEKHNLAVNI